MATITGTAANNRLVGTNGDDLIDGLAGNDNLLGRAGNDTLIGDIGNDILNGGLGIDSMIGGSGDDIYLVDNIGDVVAENPDEGNDTVISSISYTLGSDVENLTLSGRANINGTGNSISNSITGNSRNNILTGINGNDTLRGGAGNDIYEINNTDLIIERARQGNDTVVAAFDYTLGSNLENLTLTGSDNLSATGNSLNNFLTGNSGNNILSGDRGRDSIEGGIGDDSILGGTGNDIIIFNTGDGNDTINDTSSTDRNRLTFGTGIELDDVDLIRQNNDLLITFRDTSDSIDIVDFFTGNNYRNSRLVFDDGISILKRNYNFPSIGNDSAESNDDPSLAATYRRNDIIYGQGGDDTLNGWNGNDIINGGTGDDTLLGGRGNDILMGSEGSDSLSGGTGLDTYLYHIGDGFDTIFDPFSTNTLKFGEETTLENIEFDIADDVLTLGFRNSAMDQITVASTSAGSRMVFVDGTSIRVSNYNDVVGLNNSSNNSVTGDSLNNVISTGTGNDNINGLEGNDLLTSGSGDDTILGGTGNDIIIGYTGDDSLNGGTGNDIYMFQTGDELDTIIDSGGTDTIRFNQDVERENIAIFRNGSNLVIDYGSVGGEDQITIFDQTNSANAIERIRLSNGLILTSRDINRIIQDMSTFAATNSITFESINDVKANEGLKNIIASSWHR